jgi:hypothetical protein
VEVGAPEEAEAGATAAVEAEAGETEEAEAGEAGAPEEEEEAEGAEEPGPREAEEVAEEQVPEEPEERAPAWAGVAGSAPAAEVQRPAEARSGARWTGRSRAVVAAGCGRCGPPGSARPARSAGRCTPWSAGGSARGEPPARSSDRRSRRPRCSSPGCDRRPNRGARPRPLRRRGRRASGHRYVRCPRPRRGSAARSSARDRARAEARARAARAATAAPARRERPVAGVADQRLFAASRDSLPQFRVRS